MEKKNIVIVKIGGSNGRICFGKISKDGSIQRNRDNSGGCGEAKAIIDAVRRSNKFNITVVTKILDKDYLPSEYNFYNILQLANEDMQEYLVKNNFDYMLIINGSLNCFGGAEESLIPDLCIYKMMHYFTGKILFCSCDIGIQFKPDIWSIAKPKPWSSKYKAEEYDVSKKTIYMLTQAVSLESYHSILNKKNDCFFKLENMKHFAFEKFPCLNEIQHVAVNEHPEYDLLYGGTLRGGRRTKKIAKWYFNHPSLKIQLYGNLDQDKLLAEAQKMHGSNVFVPEYGDQINYLDNSKKINNALATLVIGDDLYEWTNTVQQRAYESMCANVITFIDANLDKRKTIFGFSERLSKFMYLNSPSELEQKIEMLKKNPKLRLAILEIQRKLINFDYQEWANDLANKIIQ